jgi:hypothetical protein
LKLTVSALVSGLIERAPLSFPMIFLGLGLLMGERGLGLLPLDVHPPLEIIATLSLALVCSWTPSTCRSTSCAKGGEMDFYAMLDQVVELLQSRQRVTYRTLKRQFDLDDTALENLKEELLFIHPQIVDEDGRGLVWTGETPSASADPPPVPATLALETPQAPSRPGPALWPDWSSCTGPCCPVCRNRVVSSYGDDVLAAPGGSGAGAGGSTMTLGEGHPASPCRVRHSVR